MVWGIRIKYDDPNNQLADKDTFSAALLSVVEYMNKYILGTATLNLTVTVGANGGFSGGGAVRLISQSNGINLVGPVAAAELANSVNTNGDTADLQILVDPSSAYFLGLAMTGGSFESPVSIPKKLGEVQTVILHELLHGFGIAGYRDLNTSQFPSENRTVWDAFSEASGGKMLLNMPTFAGHGVAPLTLTSTKPNSNYYHFGNTGDIGVSYLDDVMGAFQSVTERRGLSKLDLYVLENLGYKVVIPADLPLSYKGQYSTNVSAPTLIDDFGRNAVTTNTLTVHGKSAPGAMTSVLENDVLLGTTTADVNGAWSLKVKVDPAAITTSIFVRDGTSVTDSAPLSIMRSTSDLELSASSIYPHVLGGNGNDSLIAGNENDALDGAAGVDTAVFAGKRINFTTTKTASGFSVLDKVGPGGLDSLTNVERIKFDDATIALSLDGVAATPIAAAYTVLAQEFYIAYFGRPADSEGLKNLVSQLIASNAPSTNADALVSVYSTNKTVKAIVDNFGNSAESAALYTGSNTDFVRSIYSNILGRDPGAEGINFWGGAIDGGNLGRGQAALAILAGAQKNVSAQGLLDGALVNNRVIVGSNFTASLDTPAEQAGYSGNAAAATVRTMLAHVNASTNIVDFQGEVDQTVLGLSHAVAQNDVQIALIAVPPIASNFT
jgi:hypothetical protein